MGVLTSALRANPESWDVHNRIFHTLIASDASSLCGCFFYSSILRREHSKARYYWTKSGLPHSLVEQHPHIDLHPDIVYNFGIPTYDSLVTALSLTCIRQMPIFLPSLRSPSELEALMQLPCIRYEGGLPVLVSDLPRIFEIDRMTTFEATNAIESFLVTLLIGPFSPFIVFGINILLNDGRKHLESKCISLFRSVAYHQTMLLIAVSVVIGLNGLTLQLDAMM